MVLRFSAPRLLPMLAVLGGGDFSLQVTLEEAEAQRGNSLLAMLGWVLLSCDISQSSTRTLGVLVSCECQRTAETNPFSPSPGARSLRSEYQWGWFLLRTLQENCYTPLSDLQVTTVFLSTDVCQFIVTRRSHRHLLRTAGMLEGPLIVGEEVF